MNKWFLGFLYAAMAMVPIGAIADYAATQGAGTTVFAFVCSVSKVCPATVLINSTNVEIGTNANPVRVDPTGTTTQPSNITQIGGATLTIGQQVAAASVPVILPAATVTTLTPPTTVTANLGSIAGVSTKANQDTNSATTAHTCSVAGFSELGCLGQLDDDIKAALPAGTNQIGFVGLQSNTTGGCTPTRVLSAATTNSTSVKGSAGTICSITIIQNTATAADFRLYDSASAPTCSSATGVVANYGIQANTSSPGLSPNLGPFGLNFATGIGFCLTAYDGTDTNNSASVTGIQINIAYK